jgi:hypothetical protein
MGRQQVVSHCTFPSPSRLQAAGSARHPNRQASRFTLSRLHPSATWSGALEAGKQLGTLPARAARFGPYFLHSLHACKAECIFPHDGMRATVAHALGLSCTLHLAAQGCAHPSGGGPFPGRHVFRRRRVPRSSGPPRPHLQQPHAACRDEHRAGGGGGGQRGQRTRGRA